MLQAISILSETDPEIWKAITAEKQRQEEYIELIASENYASASALAAQGSVLTNKYAEGYPSRRYYAGCEFIDDVELLAIQRAQRLFEAEYVNVQPHSGSQANAAAYAALLKPGDTLLGMSLNEGGHLTHGTAVNFSGQIYKAYQYGLNRQGYIDYDEIQAIANQRKPALLIAGYSAYSRTIDWRRMRAIADQVGAYLLVDMAHIAGLVAARLIESPLPYAHVVTCTTHKTLAGPRGGLILSACGDQQLYRRLNSAVFPGTQGGPLMHVIAAKAVAFQEALDPNFRSYQTRTLHNASAMADCLQARGYPIVSGGTDVHMFLVDLSHYALSGKAVESLLHTIHITLNKNSVPNEKRSPFITSGIRIGTPAMTRRGMGLAEATQVGQWIADSLDEPDNAERHREIRASVISLCRQYPVYPE